MPYKSPTQPLCRCCGKAIAKYTSHVHLHDRPLTEFEEKENKNSYWSRHVQGVARLKSELTKFTNRHIISVKRDYRDTTRIGSFGEWDGESYIDPYFCNGTCMKGFAYAVARDFPNVACTPYHEAKHEAMRALTGE